MKRILLAVVFSSVAQAGPLPSANADFPEQEPALVKVGWQLFYDPVLSGNREVACASCHHPDFGTSDGVSLGLGDGALALGLDRHVTNDNMPEQRIPRNAPALFNLGAKQFTTLFHDGRLQVDASQPDGIRTPLGAEMITGFSGVLSAQSMFPVLSGDEMAGHYSENDIAQAVRLGLLTGPDGAWDRIAKRVLAIEPYKVQLEKVFGGAALGFTHVSDALAAFMASEWRSDNSSFDRYLRDNETMSDAAMRGMQLFYGKAACDTCHVGQFQTDHDFHAIAMPQLGPGKAARFERHQRDVGRMRVTGDETDAYAFRTPSLRNVTVTAPYGHSGAYANLESVVLHHLDPVKSLLAYEKTQAVLPELTGADDWWVMNRPEEVSAIAAANELEAQVLSEDEIADLLIFLEALSDPEAIAGRLGVPSSVPSGLEVVQSAVITKDSTKIY